MEGEGCALAETFTEECNTHFVDWDLLLKVYPWDNRLRQHFPKEVINQRIKELELSSSKQQRVKVVLKNGRARTT
jgi:hypothetical protein